MKLSRNAKLLRSTIEEGCLVSSDDFGMSRYYRVPLYEVMAIRQAQDERLAEEEANRMPEEAAASAQLKDALQGLFRKWERDNGFRKGAGEYLLPRGYAA
jgi:hypothetical protein